MHNSIETILLEIVGKHGGQQQTPMGVELSGPQILTLPLDDLDIDSMSFLEVMFAVEETFDIEFGNVTLGTFASLAEVAEKIRTMRG
jgi:acyl carrier protein